MSDLIPFDYDGRPVRLFDRGGEPWFLASDVCAVLGISNVGNALARLDEDEKGSIRLADGTSGNPNRAIISEAGLYDLIVRSDKPGARPFRRWITHEVLPSIRKTGGYGRPNLAEIGRRELAELIIAEADRADAAEKALAEAAPKIEAHDAYMSADGCYSMGTVAQMLGLGQNALFARLRDEHILIAGGRRHNTPYQQYLHHFKVAAHTFRDDDGVDHASYTTYVRNTGVEFLRKVLKMPLPSEAA